MLTLLPFRRPLQQINKPVIKFELALSDRKVTMDFIEYNLIKSTARLRTNIHPNSPSEVINPSIRTFRGNVLDANGGFASMTIADQYILIVYQIGKDVFYLGTNCDWGPNQFRW
jgi:hypothetical protein